MEFDFNTLLIGLIRLMGEAKCETRKEGKDTDSLWCLYGQLHGYEKMLIAAVKACKDEGGADLLNRINDELIDSLVCFVEADLDRIEHEQKENASRDTIWWRDAEVCKPEVGVWVLAAIKTERAGFVITSIRWLGERWEGYSVPLCWAPLNLPEEDQL